MMRVVITGAPCTGKSTILESLNLLNHSTFPEAARKVIKEQLILNSDKVPWRNNLDFSELVVQQQLKDFHNAKHHINFYDRGFPDVIAYMKFHKQEMSINLFDHHVNKNKYHSEVFILPPWQEVYSKDMERHESFEQSVQIHELLCNTYYEFGYKLTEVPLVKPEERVKFILDRCQ